ncbi:hypothetical protein Q766_20690 [Flavobacterium subsaxonicum WB 4.1-42 = DSM 21790]|uniref:Uncharacterized protein n=2 Tax=Flavobacterium TaxID=237 RepID=A0A0A2MF92_9FLAO|nr:hypothetical protein Q766_20690 [Flavobacterium subsaxonicum WB 4.1-42 = DSM 21790]
MKRSDVDLREKLVLELSYQFMKNMTRDEYFIFAKGIFAYLIPYKNNGLTEKDMFSIINPEIYHGQYLKMDTEEIFGMRLETLLNELIAYCGTPIFWDSDFDDYIKKWDDYYKMGYFL